MKLTCKDCGKKMKVKSKDEIVCDRDNCCLKFDMIGDVFDCSKVDFTTEGITTLSSFSSSLPEASVQKEWNEGDWAEWCATHGPMKPTDY